MNNAKPKHRMPWWQPALLILLLPMSLAILLLAIPFYVIYAACLRVAIWSTWNSRGRDILFVYSDSPHWRDYIQEHILPRIQERGIILNWSQRKTWRLSLRTLAFYHFGGGREFNPMAVLFRPFCRTRVFRFWQPFQDLKHGHPEKLQLLQADFFDLLDAR